MLPGSEWISLGIARSHEMHSGFCLRQTSSFEQLWRQGRLGRWARPSRVNLFARIIIITKTVKILDALFLRWVSCFIEVSEISITFRSFDRSTCKILLHDLSSANLQCFVVTFSLNSSPATDRICPSLTRGLEDWTHSDAHWVIWSVTTTDFLLE